MPIVKTLPSGLVVELRKWKLSDRQIVKNLSLIKQGTVLQRALGAATVRVHSSGPYSHIDPQSPHVDWDNVAWVDILDGLMAVRQATRPTLHMSEPCSTCREPVPFDVDLSGLQSTSMHPMAVRHIETKEPMQIYVDEVSGAYYLDEPSFRAVGHVASDLVQAKLRLSYGYDTKDVVKMKRQDPNLDTEVAQMCLLIEEMTLPGSTQPVTGQDREKLRRTYGERDFGLQEGLRNAVNELSGGMDTRVPMTCPSCGTTDVHFIPFGPEFFMM